jgi:hypothetical protein
MDKFINESGLDFTDISSELYREYEFPPSGDRICNDVIHINSPMKLNVSKSGGHRIFDENGVSHYIPSGWIHLSWCVKDGQPNFVK